MPSRLLRRVQSLPHCVGGGELDGAEFHPLIERHLGYFDAIAGPDHLGARPDSVWTA